MAQSLTTGVSTTHDHSRGKDFSSTMFAMDFNGSGFLLHRSDAGLPTARGLSKNKMTKRGLGKFYLAIFATCSRNIEILVVFNFN